jgi:hypothetical protein
MSIFVTANKHKPTEVSKVHTIDFDFDHDYTLIGIHSMLEDYHMAFYLNQELNLYLSRYKDDLDFKSRNCSFSLYTFDDEVTFTNWSLISNKYASVNDLALEYRNLFEEETRISYLIPEKRRVDYFIKVYGLEDDQRLNTTLQKINRIHKVITSYSIDVMELKSRDNLIF